VCAKTRRMMFSVVVLSGVGVELLDPFVVARVFINMLYGRDLPAVFLEKTLA